MGFSAHVVQRPYLTYLSFTTFNFFDHDHDYNYNYNYDYDYDHYTTRATYLAVQIFATTKGNGQSNRQLANSPCSLVTPQKFSHTAIKIF